MLGPPTGPGVIVTGYGNPTNPTLPPGTIDIPGANTPPPSPHIAPPGQNAPSVFGGSPPPIGPAAPPSAAPVAAPSSAPAASQDPFASDPGYAASLAAEQLGVGSINQNLNNQIAQRIIAYGDANLASQAGFGMDPQAAAFARQNYLSGNAELARLDKQHQLNRQAIINRLAGHGLLFSGETGYDAGQEDTGYGNNVYDASQKALADILGYRAGALTGTQNLHAQTIQSLGQAYQNFLNHPELGGFGQQPQTPQSPSPAKTSTKAPSVSRPSGAKAAAKALVNPYTTGQKRFG